MYLEVVVVVVVTGVKFLFRGTSLRATGVICLFNPFKECIPVLRISKLIPLCVERKTDCSSQFRCILYPRKCGVDRILQA